MRIPFFAMSFIVFLGVGSHVSASTPRELIEAYRRIMNIERLSICDKANAVIEVAYPNGSAYTGWAFPTSPNSAYARDFEMASNILDQAFVTQVRNECQVVPNDKCCKQSAIESCIDNKSTACKMDAYETMCQHGSNMCIKADDLN